MSDTKLTAAQLGKFKKQAGNLLDNNQKPPFTQSLGGFFKESARSVRFILAEKENITFSLLQFAVIGLMYYVFIQILAWIPEDVWKEISKNRDCDGLIGLLVTLWGFICVGIAAYPIGILTSCMSASFSLRFAGRKSTVFECLRLVLRRSWSIWIFSWTDAWWTVLRIVERMPKKNDHTPASVKIRDELVYQAWKLASLGFLPALMNGRSIKNALADSLALLKHRFIPLAKLRFGYSLVCWIIGIGCYVGSIFWVCYHSNLLLRHEGIYGFYFMLGFPMLLALAIVMLLFRPLYIISTARLYANFAREQNLKGQLPNSAGWAISALVGFICLIIIATVIVLYRNELGIVAVLSDTAYLYAWHK